MYRSLTSAQENNWKNWKKQTERGMQVIHTVVTDRQIPWVNCTNMATDF